MFDECPNPFGWGMFVNFQGGVKAGFGGPELHLEATTRKHLAAAYMLSV